MPKVYVVGFYPYPEALLNERAFEAPYEALMATYGINWQLIDSPDELAWKSLPIIAVEEPTKHPDQVCIEDFEHPRDCIYIVGNTKHRWPSAWFDVDHRVYIPGPKWDAPLYGSQAMSIVLYDRYKKNADL